MADLIENLFSITLELIKKIPLQPLPGPAQLLLPPFHIRLELYGLYKQATDSNSFVSVPRHDSALQRQRWEAWSRCISMTQFESIINYLSILYPYFFRWTNLPTETLNWYLSYLTLIEKNKVECLLNEVKILVSALESVPEITAKVKLIPSENFPEEDEVNSEFSFEDLAIPKSSRRPYGDSFSSTGEIFCLPGHNISPPGIDACSFCPSNSSVSVYSIELDPTVPLTPQVSSTDWGTRRVSVASRSLKSSSLSPHIVNKATSSSSLDIRTSINHGDQNLPSLLRDETSALLQSTSHRIGQGMTLVRLSLQRLENLEKKVDCALHLKLCTPPPTSQYTPCPSISPDLKPLDLSLTGWITQIYHTLLE